MDHLADRIDLEAKGLLEFTPTGLFCRNSGALAVDLVKAGHTPHWEPK